MIWIEKYRPRTFEKVVNLPKEIPSSLNNLPHYLFIGRPGTGKTTTAKIIISNTGAECLTLNASDERGIQTIRDKVKNFAMSKSVDGKLKIVFLDEADALTPDAQTSLRNMIETYHSNCRFIATCNYENKIIDPLKSRFTICKFESEPAGLVGYLQSICTAEGLVLDGMMFKEIITQNNGDIRKCVNQLQRLHSLGRSILLSDLKQQSNIVQEVNEALKKQDFIKARQLLLDGNVEYDVFLEEYHTFIVDQYINKKTITANVFANTISYLADAISKINFVISKEVIVENFLLRTMVVMKSG